MRGALPCRQQAMTHAAGDHSITPKAAEIATAHAYRGVDEVVQRFERWLPSKLRSKRCGYSTDALAKRLAQAIAMHLTGPLLKMRLEDRPGGNPMRLQCAGLMVSTPTGEVRPSAKLMLSCFSKFIALWLTVLFFSLRGTLTRRTPFGKATLVNGVPGADLRVGGDASRFERYCREGNVEVLRTATRCVVQAVGPITTTSESSFLYHRFPLLALLEGSKPSVADALLFLKAHFRTALCYLSLSIRTPASCLLWRDFAEHAAAASLDHRGLIEAVVITNSNWLQQFLWMTSLPGRRFRTYMALYSLNTSRLAFKGEPDGCGEHPGLRHLNVDVILVWQSLYERELRRLGVSGEIKAVGPILWYLRGQTLPVQLTSARRVCLFDVTPKTRETLMVSGMAGSYYNANTVGQMLEDAISVVDEASRLFGIKIELVLKHKRVRMASNDESYFLHVDRLLTENRFFSLADEDCNLFDLISTCDLAIVIPFSSPAYVCSELGIPAVFYDPTREVQRPAGNDDVTCPTFAAGREELAKCVQRTLGVSLGMQ